MNAIYRFLDHITDDYIMDKELTVESLTTTLIQVAHFLPSDLVEIEEEIINFVESRKA